MSEHWIDRRQEGRGWGLCDERAAAGGGERQQGTLEPVLTTPIRCEEFLLGKALAALCVGYFP